MTNANGAGVRDSKHDEWYGSTWQFKVIVGVSIICTDKPVHHKCRASDEQGMRMHRCVHTWALSLPLKIINKHIYGNFAAVAA
jgi:hypothetical protein